VTDEQIEKLIAQWRRQVEQIEAMARANVQRMPGFAHDFYAQALRLKKCADELEAALAEALAAPVYPTAIHAANDRKG
jgi:hypothetical protein